MMRGDDMTQVHDLTAWMRGHEDAFVVVVLIVAIVALVDLGNVDARTWWAIRRQRDRTDVGRTLKAKKLAWAAVAYALALLYTLTLLDELDWFTSGIWWRMTVRSVAVTAIVTAAVMGRRFRRAYEAENWGQPETAAAQRARGIAQDATDVRQQAREARQDARDDRWEAP
jgi:hypothetical protein